MCYSHIWIVSLKKLSGNMIILFKKSLLIRIIRKLFSVPIKGYCHLINNIRIKANGVRCQSFRIDEIIYIRNGGVIKIDNHFRANSGKNYPSIGRMCG